MLERADLNVRTGLAVYGGVDPGVPIGSEAKSTLLAAVSVPMSVMVMMLVLVVAVSMFAPVLIVISGLLLRYATTSGLITAHTTTSRLITHTGLITRHS